VVTPSRHESNADEVTNRTMKNSDIHLNFDPRSGTRLARSDLRAWHRSWTDYGQNFRYDF
jgi:hypothetical protein